MLLRIEKFLGEVGAELRDIQWFKNVPYQSVMTASGQRPIDENLRRLAGEYGRIDSLYDNSEMILDDEDGLYCAPKFIQRRSEKPDWIRFMAGIEKFARIYVSTSYSTESELRKVFSFVDLYCLWEWARKSERVGENPYKPVMDIFNTGAVPKTMKVLDGRVRFRVDVPITYVHPGELKVQRALLCFDNGAKMPRKRIHKWGENCESGVETEPYRLDVVKVSKPDGVKRIFFPMPLQT